MSIILVRFLLETI